MARSSSTIVLLLLVCYLLGSIPFGLLFARLFGGGDVRHTGSGNIGATNVARVAGPLPGILTLVFDAAKGALAVWLAAHFTANSATAMMLGGLAVLLGLVFVYWRFVSLASISAAAAMPLLVYFLWAPHHAPPLVVSFGTLFASALIIYKHDANLQRLVEGTEPRFTLRKSKGDSA